MLRAAACLLPADESSASIHILQGWDAPRLMSVQVEHFSRGLHLHLSGRALHLLGAQ